MLGAAAQLELFSCDMTQPGAYDAAFAGAACVFHPAAVVTLFAEDPERDIYAPALAGNREVLAAVGRAGSVRRLVYTSSTASLKVSTSLSCDKSN
jgi:nucleoside-diphosphate-sugar epimerase